MGYVLVEDLAKEIIKAIKNRDMFCILSRRIRTDQLYVDKEMNLLELQRFFQYNKTSLAFVQKKLKKGKCNWSCLAARHRKGDFGMRKFYKK